MKAQNLIMAPEVLAQSTSFMAWNASRRAIRDIQHMAQQFAPMGILREQLACPAHAI
jgi:hypothetical protein